MNRLLGFVYVCAVRGIWIEFICTGSPWHSVYQCMAEREKNTLDVIAENVNPEHTQQNSIYNLHDDKQIKADIK